MGENRHGILGTYSGDGEGDNPLLHPSRTGRVAAQKSLISLQRLTKIEAQAAGWRPGRCPARTGRSGTRYARQTRGASVRGTCHQIDSVIGYIKRKWADTCKQ